MIILNFYNPISKIPIFQRWKNGPYWKTKLQKKKTRDDVELKNDIFFSHKTHAAGPWLGDDPIAEGKTYCI